MTTMHTTKWTTPDLMETGGIFAAARFPVHSRLHHRHHVPGRPHGQIDVHRSAATSGWLSGLLDV
jgi:hypothetical protein